MAKFFGQIGFILTVETAPGVWTPGITERNYKGDLVRDYRRWENGSSTNDNLTLGNNVSIVADSFCLENLSAMIYAKWRGCYWKITNVEVQTPRLILTLGGVYNGETPQT